MNAGRRFTFLGTGTSVGVPMIGCECAVCRSPNPKNHRLRTSALIQAPGGTVLIDTSPEVRLQLVRAGVGLVNAVVYTHYHVDHVFGLDDLRLMPLLLKAPLPLYCDADTEEVVRRVYSYAFEPGSEDIPVGVVPKVQFRRIDDTPFAVCGELLTPIPFVHGRFHVYGFRVGNLAYCTDVSGIPDRSWPLLEGLDVLILGALRPLKPHPSHFSLEQALEVIDRVRPRRAYLTHLGHLMDHDAITAGLPPGVELGYDGLEFAF
ncbi:MAG: MBL fold metallo-hydrolase [Gemmataceae bacterium]